MADLFYKFSLNDGETTKKFFVVKCPSSEHYDAVFELYEEMRPICTLIGKKENEKYSFLILYPLEVIEGNRSYFQTFLMHPGSKFVDLDFVKRFAAVKSVYYLNENYRA